jgi:cytosine/uracil/thiamine/allantoin permease
VIIVRGIESIRIAEKASAPVLIGLSAAVLVWAVRTAGGWGPMIAGHERGGISFSAQYDNLSAAGFSIRSRHAAAWAVLADFLALGDGQRRLLGGE